MSGDRGTGTAEQRAADYMAGMSLRAVGRKYGVSAQAIRDQLRRNDVPTRPLGRMREFVDSETGQDIVRRYAAGESQEKIGRALGVTQIKVSRALKMAGVQTGSWRGERHWLWKGGRVEIGRYVAVMIPDDDPLVGMRLTTGYVLEHRLVMARSLGRVLTEHETVHHINGDKHDNRLANLQLRSGQHGKGSAHRCLDCGSTNVKPVPLG